MGLVVDDDDVPLAPELTAEAPDHADAVYLNVFLDAVLRPFSLKGQLLRNYLKRRCRLVVVEAPSVDNGSRKEVTDGETTSHGHDLGGAR